MGGRGQLFLTCCTVGGCMGRSSETFRPLPSLKAKKWWKKESTANRIRSSFRFSAGLGAGRLLALWARCKIKEGEGGFFFRVPPPPPHPRNLRSL